MSELHTELTDRVLTLEIDRPAKRNALDDELLQALRENLQNPPAGAHVVLIRSTGDRVFCAGADLAVMGNDAEHQHEARGGLAQVMTAMRHCPLPVVARVQGLCLAGGVGLMLGCDLVVAAESAEFGLPEINLGLWPFMVSTLLARHVSPKVALDLMLTGRRLGAREALSLGMLSRVVADADLDTEVDALVASLAKNPPVAMRTGKAAFAAVQELSWDAGLAAMHTELSRLTETDDAQEGVAAFFAKRPPVWRGE
jgi:enoyl-CoA hydratase/carnithine racemase